MKCNYLLRVTSAGLLDVRQNPNTASKLLGNLFTGNEVIASELVDGWYYHTGVGNKYPGWSQSAAFTLVENLGADHTTTISKEEVDSDIIYVKNSNNSRQTRTDGDTTATNGKTVDQIINEHLLLDMTQYNNTDSIRDLKYIYGAPFQYTKTTDPRPSYKSGETSTETQLGTLYMDAFLRDASIMILTPGKASFMQDFDKETSRGLLASLIGGSGNDDQVSSMEEMLQGKNAEGRYYSFQSDYANYIKYVNLMCRTASMLLGIGDLVHDGVKLKNFDWGKDAMRDHSLFNGFIKKEPSVAFYIDANASSFSDGISNETGPSKLKSMTDMATDTAKELMFLFDDIEKKGMFKGGALVEASGSFIDGITSIVDSVLGTGSTNNKLGRVLSNAVNSINYGANIMYPDIYQDSSYSKSYDIVMKFATPYGNLKSYFLNILVPTFHIMGMGYPRQINSNGYSSPFLVRGFCKGMFTCGMGIITNLSIKKASNDGWNVQGLPTEVEIQFTLKDMYEVMSISKLEGTAIDPFSNIEYMDMLANWCGVNMNEKDLTRRLSIMGVMLGNRINDFAPNITRQISESISHKLRNIFN